MKKGQIFEGTVEYVAFPNKGVLNVEGEKVVVKHTVEGQKIRFSITKKRKGKCEGRLLEILEKAPQETESACPHFGICGGCEFQTLPYEEQLKMKEAQVRALLEPVCPQLPFEGILPSPVSAEYRNKMEFSFGDEYKGGPLSLGMHKRGSFYDIVPVEQCRIADEDFRKILICTLEYFRKAGLPFYQKMRHEGYLRHLLVRKAVKTGEILVDLVTSTQMETDLAPWVDALRALSLNGTFAGILHTYNDSPADVVRNDGTEILYGQDFFYEELLGLKFKISPFSFFQTNSLGAEVLYSKAREYVGDAKAKVLFDLYSGTGTIAQLLAPVAEKVVGVEIIEEAVEAAKVNAALNGLSNCEFLAGDVLKVLDTVPEKPDFIVLDPPRDGIHPKALKKIIDYGVERMLYISCKPTSLARDLAELQESGYQVERCCCVDMFPNTGNVEVVCLLSKLKAEKHIEVEIEMDELDLTAAESKATYAEIKQYVLDKTGFKVSQLYIAQVKRKHGLIERTNYNLGEKESKAPQVPPEKEQAIEDALIYFKMI